ncbi:extracellular solute-binding protein [uncultured Sphaerochaeta sp.]|uniref:extracellular solute-binding protein n=1 Tax=uncultured Sphaerochaeta sp. TaxID=886478 RepID=UPI002A0A3157|nr:extracellular solute-binding protein [uncultured Sphaerochaeta sp.]
MSLDSKTNHFDDRVGNIIEKEKMVMKKRVGKKMITIIAAMVMAAMVLTSCGSSGSTTSEATTSTGTATSSATNLKPVTLTFWSCGDKRSAQDQVLAAFCKEYKSELNIDKIKFNYVSFGDYEDKMTSLVAGGDDFEGCFVADWMLYNKMANKGAFLNLNDLLAQYAPTLYKTYKDAGVANICSIDGQMVTLPWLQKKSSKPILLFRKDLADKYGVDYSNLQTIEDIDAFLEEAHAKIPNITTFESGFPRGNTYSDVLAILNSKYNMDTMNYHMLTNNFDTKLIPIEQTEMFKKAVTWMQKWYNDGFVSKSELSETDTQEFANGKTFCRVGLYENAVQGITFNVSGAELGWAEPYPDGKFRYDSPLNNAFAINKNAANPERALMLLELLDTNEKAYDMFMYGIEGKTYVTEADGSIGYPEGQDSSNSTYLDWFKWPFIRTQFEKPSGSNTQKAIDMNNTWLAKDNFIVAPLIGFGPDTSPIKTELAQRDQLYDEQGKLLLAGIIEGGNVDVAVQNYIKAQKATGLDDILSYLQTQADSYAK